MKDKNKKGEEMPRVTPNNVGQFVEKIPVELSTRFLEHFSEQLYSSPQKAFEELISNGWDAGASIVDVRVDQNLNRSEATMTVFDNGSSMDLVGLRKLWHIAFSPKERKGKAHGRPLIGRFGIGKLATYVLANKLTYICKASDGTIRSVMMDYADVNTQKGAKSENLINDLELEVFKLDRKEMEEILKNIYGGDEILNLIDGETLDKQTEKNAEIQKEYGGNPAALERPPKGTWTLAILSELKPVGRDLRIGILRRVLASALPFSSEMAIYLNGERLKSTKMEANLVKEWVIGPEIDINSIELNEMEIELKSEEEKASPGKGAPGSKNQDPTTILVGSKKKPYPHIELPGIGRVTGMVRLFEDKISGGKSEEHGASNGFHVNVLGRIINQNDSSFGEKNLNHAAWSRFRMTVRADGLNKYLTTNREQFKEHHEIKIFRAFLRTVFNKARNVYDSDNNVIMPDGGDALVQSLGVVSLNPLRSVVSETLRTQSTIPDLFDETGIENREKKRQSWRENTADNIKKALGEVKYEKMDDNNFVKFRISDSSIVVNSNHPFVLEHSRSKAEKKLMRTIAMIDLLVDMYALDIGVDPDLLINVRDYRDKLMRFRALQRRESGVHIARLLKETQHDSSNSDRFERVVSDAFRYLDFDVQDLGQPGEPEGIAKAFPIPTRKNPTQSAPRPPLYSFSFDAKSSKHATVKTGNVSLDAVVEHRDRYEADHALVIAPAFSKGALVTRCKKLKVTPMRACDLGKLLEYTVKYGAIPVNTFREIFDHADPRGVSKWVGTLAGRMQASRKLTIDIFIRALDELKGKIPDTLTAATLALTCRDTLGIAEVRDRDVILLAKGLQVIVPDLVGIDGDKIVVNASASHVAAAISAQLEKLHEGEDGDDGK